jgi:hypothetical protein
MLRCIFKESQNMSFFFQIVFLVLKLFFNSGYKSLKE